jgi:hypothetical protein
VSTPTPHRFDHPVWDLRDVIGWVLDRDPAKFGRIHTMKDAQAAVDCALFYPSQPRTERDPRALTTILHAMQAGQLVAHKGDTGLPREHWGAQTEIGLRSAISRGLWFWREDVLRLWPVEAASVPPPLIEPIRASSSRGAFDNGGSQDRAANWQIWKHIIEVKLYEAVALSLNIDPKKIRHNSHSWMAGRRLFDEDQEFKDRLFLVERSLDKLGVLNFANVGYLGGDPVISLKAFAAWAVSIGWELPNEITELADAAKSRPTPTATVATQQAAVGEVEASPRPVRRSTKRDAVISWVADRYPEGIQPGTSQKEIARQFEAETKVQVDVRTVRRALGGV